MLFIKDIKLPLDQGEQDAINIALDILKIPSDFIKDARISKLSVDARHRKPSLVYTVAVALNDDTNEEKIAQCSPLVSFKKQTNYTIEQGKTPLATRPVVCGFGPAGIFSALLLARSGYNPIVIERGGAIPERTLAVEDFINLGKLDVNSNIQFGEGGAGAFSDGKLTTRIGDNLCEYVIKTFLEHGAPPEIAYLKKPHVGTDILRNVIISIREEIKKLGGEIMFSTTLLDLVIKNNKLVGIVTNKGEIPCQNLILATGHSARDTIAMLDTNKVSMTAKSFSVGFRVEHLQADIEKSLYHDAAGHPALPRGEYQLSCRLGNRGIYTFCMCPGGEVLPAASQENGVVVNGMSYHARDGENANSAVVVGVTEQDFDGDYKKAIKFQEDLESKAFAMAGSDYSAPAQNVQSFVSGDPWLSIKTVTPSYSKGVTSADLSQLLPQQLTTSLKYGLTTFGKRIRGFDSENAILTGVETRTSSPVRVVRGENLQSVNIEGIYPTGEGAGYAGGIVSAGVDGLKVATAIIQNNAPFKAII